MHCYLTGFFVVAFLAAASSLRSSSDGRNTKLKQSTLLHRALPPRSSYEKARHDLMSVVGNGLFLGGLAVCLPQRVAAADALVFPKDCSDSISALKGPLGREVCVIGVGPIVCVRTIC